MAVSEAEAASRAAILRRFRALLVSQRERFESYITALDKQKDAIPSGDAAELIAHVELEEKIINDILAIQKVIEPMRSMLPAASVQPPEVADISAVVENLRKEAASRVIRNKDLLSERMAQIREELKTLRANPFSRRKSIFGSGASPSIIDISG